MRPVDVVRRLCPHAKSSYLLAFENGDALFRKAGITTPIRLAHFLAQSFHETGGLTVEWESGAYSAARLMEIFGVGHHSAAVTVDEAQKLAHNGPAIFERVYGLGNPKKAKELGNTEPGDGYKYRGGGILQTTGRANYRRMGVKCNVDFEAHPDLVLSSAHALKPALAEWSEGNLNVAADRDDLIAITRKINGGLNGIEDRKQWYARIRPLITSVELKDAPKLPAHPAADDSKTKKVAKGAVAGGTIVAGSIAAKNAHDGGASVALVIALVIAALIIGTAIFFFMHRKKDNRP